jgi:hypothetical protein
MRRTRLARGASVPRRTRLLPTSGQVRIEVDIPTSVDTPKKLSKYLWKNYHFEISTEEDYEDHLFYNPDLRSEMGFVEESGSGSVILVVFPKYFAEFYPDEWKKLSKVSRVIPE